MATHSFEDSPSTRDDGNADISVGVRARRRVVVRVRYPGVLHGSRERRRAYLTFLRTRVAPPVKVLRSGARAYESTTVQSLCLAIRGPVARIW